MRNIDSNIDASGATIGIVSQNRRTPTSRGGQIQKCHSGECSKLYSTWIQERSSEEIDGYLVVVFGLGSESRQERSLFVFASGIQATETDHQIAQSGVVFGSVFGARSGLIFAKGNISNVVERVLDCPVAPAETLELRGVHFSGRAARDEDFGFFSHGNRLEMMSGAVDHGSLKGVRESRALRSDLERIDRAGFMPAVALVQGDIRRGKKRRFRPWRARRVCRRAWVDCL